MQLCFHFPSISETTPSQDFKQAKLCLEVVDDVTAMVSGKGLFNFFKFLFGVFHCGNDFPLIWLLLGNEGSE